MVYQPNPNELKGGIRHIVYEYGHLVFAGQHTLTAPGKPIDNVVQDAFLMNCRKLAEFFGNRSSTPKMKAAHYCTVRQFPKVALVKWKKWWDAIDNQIAHLSYTRVTAPKPWYGYDGTM